MTLTPRFRHDIRPALKAPLPAKGETKRKYVKRMSKDEQIQKGNNLWQFLMRLLGEITFRLLVVAVRESMQL